MKSTIINTFFNNSNNNPHKVAIYCRKDTITYENLANRVIRKYFILKEFLSSDDVLCFQMENSIDSVETLLASITLGITLAPINPTLPIKKMFKIAKAIKAKYCLPTLHNYQKMTEEEKVLGIPQNIYENNNTNEKNNYEELNNQNTNSSFNLLSMTSGTTGEPKAFLLNEDCILNRIKSHIEAYNINDKDVILSSTPLYHFFLFRHREEEYQGFALQ